MLKKILILFLCFWMSCGSVFAMNGGVKNAGNVGHARRFIGWAFEAFDTYAKINFTEEVVCLYNYFLAKDTSKECYTITLCNDIKNDIKPVVKKLNKFLGNDNNDDNYNDNKFNLPKK